MSSAILLRNVSKRFILHHDRPRSFQELMLKALGRNNKGSKEEFWALRDLNLTIEQGETLGVIGSNGAGKSTLLKLITRILQPTSGEIRVDGRLTALLELGAGFHPDLTGRENVFLNGSILGLTAREMRARLDDIVAFAELERFIDVPLRHYSSGMQVRLGFAVATSLDPDLLLIDEVLAVGDEGFQKKCLERIDDFRRQGKTILFVSHDLESVKRLCSRALWLEAGMLAGDGAAVEVVESYRQHIWKEEARKLAAGAQPAEMGSAAVSKSPPQRTEGARWGSGEVLITDTRLLNPSGQPIQLLRSGEPLSVEIHYAMRQRVSPLVFGIAIYRSDGLRCYGTNTDIDAVDLEHLPPEGAVSVDFDRLNLVSGTYTLDVAIHDQIGNAYDYYHPYCTFVVRSHIQDVGVYRPVHRWRIRGRSSGVREVE
jgi:ABC-type polysaccharide/polyol phosphate transport system ATPase subunit